MHHFSHETTGGRRSLRSQIIGWTLTVIGCLFQLAGLLCLGFSNHYRDKLGVFILSTFVMLAFVLPPIGWKLVGYGRRLQMPRPLPDVLTREKNLVLYLRPFGTDEQMDKPGLGRQKLLSAFMTARTEGEQLARAFKRFGIMVAIGNSREPLPHLVGPHLVYVNGEEERWRVVVTDLMRRASLVILNAGQGKSETWGPNITWEFKQANLVDPEKLLLLVPVECEKYLEFRKKIGPLLSNYTLPEYPERPIRGDQSFKIAVLYDENRDPQVKRLDPTIFYAGRGYTEEVLRKTVVPIFLKRFGYRPRPRLITILTTVFVLFLMFSLVVNVFMSQRDLDHVRAGNCLRGTVSQPNNMKVINCIFSNESDSIVLQRVDNAADESSCSDRSKCVRIYPKGNGKNWFLLRLGKAGGLDGWIDEMISELIFHPVEIG